jgi:hypothetical protein
MDIMISSKDVYGAPFPLVLADRFFHIYKGQSGIQVDIFRWDEKSKTAAYEVKGGITNAFEMSQNPTGIVSLSEPNKGTFIYKFRAKPGVVQILGKAPVKDNFEAIINERQILVMRGDNLLCSLETDQFAGRQIGIQVFADGTIKTGVNTLPEGMTLVRK